MSLLAWKDNSGKDKILPCHEYKGLDIPNQTSQPAHNCLYLQL